MSDEFDDFEGFSDLDDEEYEDSLAGRFEKTVDQIVDMRLSISNGICDQIKQIANKVRGVDEDDEDYEPGPVVKVVDTVNSVDQAIVEGTARAWAVPSWASSEATPAGFPGTRFPPHPRGAREGAVLHWPRTDPGGPYKG